MNDLEKFISETRDEKNPMDNWTRVIIETVTKKWHNGSIRKTD